MTKSLFNDADRATLVARVKMLTSASRREWGRMTVQQMLERLSLPIRTAMGENPVPSKNKKFMQMRVAKILIIHVVPWPKGRASTANEYDEVLNNRTGPGVAEGRATLVALVERFANLPPNAALGEHPTFGIMSRAEWGHLQYKHIDHHLKQFGV